MDRNYQIAATSTSSEQGNIRKHFSYHQVQLIFALSVTLILLLSTPKIKIREINLGYGKIVSQKLKFI